MHPTAEDGFARMLRSASLPRTHSLDSARVLDVGGADVNGTVHQLLLEAFGHRAVHLDVLDVAPGQGVTIVADATDPGLWDRLAAPDQPYDLVISTETLEHVEDWRTVVWGVARVLRPGGWFVGTCASIGRRPHGARGEFNPPAGEWYANVDPSTLQERLADNFEGDIVVEYNRRHLMATTCDLYWRAQMMPA